MKNKVYTISLLLSFLIILIHDAMPHHHASDTLVKTFCWDSIVENSELNYKSHHIPLKDESEQSSSNEERSCDNKFPLHHHLSVTDIFSYVRPEVAEVDSQIQLVLSLLSIIELFSYDFTQDSVAIKRFYATDFLVSSQFFPTTIFLRGPPILS